MNTETLKKNDFIDDVKFHELSVLLDHGDYRHLVFKKQVNSSKQFEIIMWKNGITISGDMGTYTFKRIKFEDIDTKNWEHSIRQLIQRCESESVYEKMRKFNIKRVWAHLDLYLKNFITTCNDDNDDNDAELLINNAKKAVADLKKSHGDTEIDCIMGINEWTPDSAGGLELDDFWTDLECDVLTYYFQWCCHAIVWGIQEYIKSKL